MIESFFVCACIGLIVGSFVNFLAVRSAFKGFEEMKNKVSRDVK